jgi:uncharacterized Zn-binding protein involved in type VI secretion
MAEELVARITDTISHGGAIIEGSPNDYTNGLNTARVGDAVVCAIHGLVAIKTGSCKVRTNGRPSARRIKDITTCNALITSGSPNTKDEIATVCTS